MKTTNKLSITKNLTKKRIEIVREFAAPLDKVWGAWTDSSKLDLWFAPKPWKAITKVMDFREGGRWLYCMSGPKGEKTWGRLDYKRIVPLVSFTAEDSFCDEFGVDNTELPKILWRNKFLSTETGCKVMIEMSFKKSADLETILNMGFEEGFTAAIGNLEKLLVKRHELIKGHYRRAS